MIDEVFEELDESGARRDRPLLGRALERVESGESGGIVVAKLDRFGRSLVDSLAAIERITAAGGTFVSVRDGLDLTTDTGRLVLRIMLSMAEWELDRIVAAWRDARARAIARGVYIGPCVPVGYRKLDSGRLEVDPQTGPVVAEALRRLADRQSLYSVCRFLERHGVGTARGNPGWSSATLRRSLGRRTYLGEVRSGDLVNRRAHKPLVDVATWELARSPLVFASTRVGEAPTARRHHRADELKPAAVRDAGADPAAAGSHAPPRGFGSTRDHHRSTRQHLPSAIATARSPFSRDSRTDVLPRRFSNSLPRALSRADEGRTAEDLADPSCA